VTDPTASPRRPAAAGPALALAAIAALSAGCWVPLERGRMMEDRLARLEADADAQRKELERERAAVKDRVAQVDRKIVEVQAKIDELNQAARRSGADLGVSLNRLAEDFAKVRGDLEVEQHRLGELEKALAAVKSETEGRFAALRGTGALDEYEARRRTAGLAAEDKGAFLALAEREDATGDKGVARELFQQYVRRWPQDPRAALAGVRAGDILMTQRRFREALLSYGKVAEDFPRSEEAPAALLGAAEAMLRLEMKDDAKGVLERVVAEHPKSPAAGKAKARLAELWPPPKPAARPKAKPPAATQKKQK
jgi:TolA-binding protein